MGWPPASEPVGGVGDFAPRSRPFRRFFPHNSRWSPRGILTAVGCDGSSYDPPPAPVQSRAGICLHPAGSGPKSANLASRRSLPAPFPQKKGCSVTSRRRSLARRRPASIYGIRVEEFDPPTGGGSWVPAGETRNRFLKPPSLLSGGGVLVGWPNEVPALANSTENLAR